MLFVDVKMYETMFQQNMQDWCMGGPKRGGWTRFGTHTYLEKKVALKKMKWAIINVDDGLAKNKDEVHKWHISYLQGDHRAYQQEYLLHRYDKKEAEIKCKNFMSLFENIKNEGYNTQHPIYVADVEILGLGFKYFRFDGCHRLSCCKFLGITEVPAFVFTLREVR